MTSPWFAAWASSALAAARNRAAAPANPSRSAFLANSVYFALAFDSPLNAAIRLSSVLPAAGVAARATSEAHAPAIRAAAETTTTRQRCLRFITTSLPHRIKVNDPHGTATASHDLLIIPRRAAVTPHHADETGVRRHRQLPKGYASPRRPGICLGHVRPGYRIAGAGGRPYGISLAGAAIRGFETSNLLSRSAGIASIRRSALAAGYAAHLVRTICLGRGSSSGGSRVLIGRVRQGRCRRTIGCGRRRRPSRRATT